MAEVGHEGRGHEGRASTVCVMSDSRLCWCAEYRNLTIRTEEMNNTFFSQETVNSSGCGLHARVPRLNPLPDAVHRTNNGTSTEGAVAMELGALYFGEGGEKMEERKKPAKTYSNVLKPAVSQPTASPGRRALCCQRYVDRTGGEELARCSNTYVANEITCDGTLDITISLSFGSGMQDNTGAL